MFCYYFSWLDCFMTLPHSCNHLSCLGTVNIIISTIVQHKYTNHNVCKKTIECTCTLYDAGPCNFVLGTLWSKMYEMHFRVKCM